MTIPTFLAVGHFCYDVAPDGYIIGGSAAYSTITAQNLGYRAGAVTAVGANFDREQSILDGVEVVYHESPETTIFDNRYDADGHREQLILGVGGTLKPHHVPHDWKDVEVAYLCPIANEVHPELVHSFNNALIGVTPQGWMRQWDENRRVRAKRWDSAPEILPHVDVLILSDEDILAYPDDLERYIQLTRIVILTKGKHGAILYENGHSLKSIAYPANEADPTGAGDVFAAAFLIKYSETRSTREALNFAHCVASFAVEGKGATSIPTLDRVQTRLKIGG